METTAAPDHGFGFDNPEFSNKIIRLVVLPDSADFTSTTRKRHRRSSSHSKGDDEASTSSEENCIHVNSLILAGQSPFFLKLFSNGMKESGEQHVNLHIKASEEAAVVDLLKYIYSGTLSSDTPSALLDVLIAADKFEVVSCIKHCGNLLLGLPMTLKSALRYLDLASSPMADTIRPLTYAATKFIAEHFKNLNKARLKKKLLKLPLVGVEAVFASDCLRVKSEDDIYDLMLKWVQTCYSDKLDERRTIMNSLVQRFLRFQFLSTKKLKSIMTRSDIDPAIASGLALQALSYLKSRVPRPLHQQTPDKLGRRAYRRLPLKAVVADNSSSHQHYVIYLDLKRDDCENISPGGVVKSESFFLGEHKLALCIYRNQVRDRFSLFFMRDRRASKLGLKFACDISTRKKDSDRLLIRKGDLRISEGDTTTTSMLNLFASPWTTVFSKDSPYFINGVLLLKCDLTVTIM